MGHSLELALAADLPWVVLWKGLGATAVDILDFNSIILINIQT
jgi:hypothetical protein